MSKFKYFCFVYIVAVTSVLYEINEIQCKE